MMTRAPRHRYDPEAAPQSVHLALSTSSAVDTSYQGVTGDAVEVYGWAGGYEWQVEFLSTSDPLTIASPEHSLVPASSSVGVRPKDCDECLYATGLEAFGVFYVRARAVSAHARFTCKPHQCAGP